MSDFDRVLVERTVLQLMSQTAGAAEFRHEVGGILLGAYRGRDLHITAATKPGASDRAAFSWFRRAPTGHQQAAERAWRSSRGTVTYVGEWHSHPESRPNPSGVDLASWRRKTREQQRDLVFLIQGLLTVHGEVGAQAGQRYKLSEVANDQRGILFALNQ